METNKAKTGRNPIDPKRKKAQVCIYVEQRYIDVLGGKKEVVEFALQQIEIKALTLKNDNEDGQID